MNINQLRELMDAVPFTPFSLVLPNGGKLRVPHPDFIWVHPSGRSVSVALKGDVIRIVNGQMVTGIEMQERTPKWSRREPARRRRIFSVT